MICSSVWIDHIAECVRIIDYSRWHSPTFGVDCNVRHHSAFVLQIVIHMILWTSRRKRRRSSRNSERHTVFYPTQKRKPVMIVDRIWRMERDFHLVSLFCLFLSMFPMIIVIKIAKGLWKIGWRSQQHLPVISSSVRVLIPDLFFFFFFSYGV